MWPSFFGCKMKLYTVLLILKLCCLAMGNNSDCIFTNVESCKKIGQDDECRCPCLPKCCPNGQVLLDSGPNHGLGCVEVGQELPLPDVPLMGMSEVNTRFFQSVFPSCKGLPPDWQFETHTRDRFKVNVDYEEEYVLHVNVTKEGKSELKPIKIHSNPDNPADHDLVDTRPRFKPLLHFCFDLTESLQTVAVTCPRYPLKKTVPFNKCCPNGQSMQNFSCQDRETKIKPWRLPINGHLFSNKFLEKRKKLVYNKEKSYIEQDVVERCRENPTNDYSWAMNDFHLGPDGKLHFTTAHTNINTFDFCVDENLVDTEDFLNYDDSESNSTDDYYEEFYEDEETTQSPFHHYNCHKEPRPHTLVAMYCAEKILHTPKCCPKGENLNLRGRSCTTHRAEEFPAPPIYWENDDGQLETHVGHVDVVVGWEIYSMNKSHLVLSNEDFYLLDNRSLLYQDRLYPEHSFCLDYGIDYCEGDGLRTLNLKAVLNDPYLVVNGMTSILGNNNQEAPELTIFKYVGYFISIVFLMLTLVIFLVCGDLRKELHGKMATCFVACMLVTYICLFIRNFEPKTTEEAFANEHRYYWPISKSSPMCITISAVFYYFVLSSFGWMSAMSYNIMSTFWRTEIQSIVEGNHVFLSYASFSFGIPAVMLTTVLALDRTDTSTDPLNGNNNATVSSNWRPGFGEETCWFTSCSYALKVYLYGPIVMVMLANIAMVSYSAMKMFTMYRRIGNSSYRNNASEKPQIGQIDQNENRRKKFMRQLSTQPVVAMSRKLLSEKVNKDRLITYMKLFATTGMTWLLEIAAWLWPREVDTVHVTPLGTQITLNLLNVFQGVIIFMVFAAKKTVMEKIGNRFKKCLGIQTVASPYKQHSSQRTNSSRYSRSNSLNTSRCTTTSFKLEVTSDPGVSMTNFLSSSSGGENEVSGSKGNNNPYGQVTLL